MRKLIAVDIDETICDTRRFWFSELAQRFGKPIDVTIEQLIQRYEYTDRVEMWQTPGARKWLKDARFDPEIHRSCLEPVRSARESLEYISRQFDVIYMTMRPDTIVDATREWLQREQFPSGEVLASPAFLFDRERPGWKGRELCARHPNVVGLIDDHPDVANAIPNSYRGKVFLLGQSVAPRSDIEIVLCEDWNRVVQAVAIAFPRALQP